LIKRGPQDLAIGNPALTPFTTKLVRTLDGILLNSGDECVAYFNVIADPANPLETPLRMTVLVRMSVDSVMTMKLRIKKLVYAGLESVRATLIP
jgi:hypothetical protein